MQYLGRYLEGQGHSMTLKQNCVWTKTLLFEVRILNNFTEMIAGKTWCHVQYLGHYLEGQGHSMTLKQNRVRPITFFSKSNLKTISQ